MALILVRHTRPSVTGLCYGRSEVALAESFAQEAEALCTRLAPVRRIVSSPLERCRRLAEFVADRLGATVSLASGWQEMDFGAWEALAWDEVPRAELDAWADDFMHARPHGGESVAMLLSRVERAIAECLARESPCVVITHAGPIRAALFSRGDAAAWNRTIPFASSIALPPE